MSKIIKIMAKIVVYWLKKGSAKTPNKTDDKAVAALDNSIKNGDIEPAKEVK